ncbi:BrnT family toxin [Paracoccus sanguinis]|uniref:BrnT family toxin n=1 Tax=Paracoccus sanguinis TaxID=1545044 RepID=A0A1H2RH96_9RHOB|nr:BrnT family toxin [Paracoccus sanguinis]KGJ17365.1 hypothetical protein IX57_08585 [Paracoccus sanguinis]SDW18826.1 hypothetical protein SAMN05444276_101347 [Paracoccus sanguinis]
MFEWDDDKRAANLAKHGVDLAAAGRLDWGSALTVPDERGDYGEARFVSILPLDRRLHVCVWTWRARARRIISLRKANAREERFYGKELY